MRVALPILLTVVMLAAVFIMPRGEPGAPPVYELFYSDRPYMDRWEDHLPVIEGAQPDNEDDRSRRNIRLFVDALGGVTRFGEELGAEEVLETVFVHADSDRDMHDVAQSSMVEAKVHLDRDMQAVLFRDLLFTLNHPAVRFRNIFLPAKFSDEGEPDEWGAGITLWITATWFEKLNVRIQKTAFDLVLSDLPEAPGGADLHQTLSAADRGTRLDGVRVRVGSKTPVSRIIPVLVALGQVKDLRILLDLRKEDAPPIQSGLELDGVAVRTSEIRGELDARIELEIQRP